MSRYFFKMVFGQWYWLIRWSTSMTMVHFLGRLGTIHPPSIHLSGSLSGLSRRIHIQSKFSKASSIVIVLARLQRGGWASLPLQ